MSTAETAHETFDQLLSKMLENEPPAPCRAGCSACCMEPAYATSQEAQLIVERICEMPKADQERIVAGVEAAAKRLADWPGLADQLPNAFAYRKLRLMCPLLHEGLCTVYKDRPLGCRSHIARSNPEMCADDRLRPKQQFLLPPPELMGASMAPMVTDGGVTEMDHIILLLHRILFGTAPESGARFGVRVSDD